MTLRDFISRLVKEHIVDEFPYPVECFDCNKLSCEGCSEIDETRGERNADQVPEMRLV